MTRKTETPREKLDLNETIREVLAIVGDEVKRKSVTRVRQLNRRFQQLRDVVETIPAMTWTALPDGTIEFVNKRCADFTGCPRRTRPVSVG
jgi:PAS domain-containing protein